MTDLSVEDGGKQIRVKDMQTIITDSNERLYEWLHNWAGLYLDVQKLKGTTDSPTFIKADDQSSLSTKLIMSRIWQRMISKSVLNLQLNQLQDKKAFLPEVLEEFKKVKEFQQLINVFKGLIKDFK